MQPPSAFPPPRLTLLLQALAICGSHRALKSLAAHSRAIRGALQKLSQKMRVLNKFLTSISELNQEREIDLRAELPDPPAKLHYISKASQAGEKSKLLINLSTSEQWQALVTKASSICALPAPVHACAFTSHTPSTHKPRDSPPSRKGRQR